MRVLTSLPVCLGVLVLFNVPVSLHRWAATGDIRLLLVPAVESVILVWILFLILRGPSLGRPRRRRQVGVGTLLGVFAGLSGAEAFFQYYYARSFSLRGDLPMVRGALLLFFGEIGPVVYVLGPLTIILILVILASAGSLLTAAASAILSRIKPGYPAILGMTLIALVPTAALGPPSSITVATVRATLRAGTTELVDLGLDAEPDGTGLDGVYAEDRRGEEHYPERYPVETTEVDAPEASRYRLPGLRDRDIHVFVIEAYGYASTYRPELTEHLDPYRYRLEEALQSAGYDIVTQYLQSPVAGGYSWLADATFLTGQWINSQERFLQLYDAQVPSLGGMLHDAGYYTFTVRPGTVHEPWPEGWDLFRFEESMIAYGGGFAYRGPRFSYVSVPDQYAIWKGHQRVQELTAAGSTASEQPLFVHYQLVSSHTPFNRIPPFIERWEDLDGGEIYNERAGEIQYFDNTWTGGTELIEGYTASIQYVFTVLTDYVERVMEHSRDPIIVIFGDHEPQRPIRSAQSVLSVPVHVASRDGQLLRCLGEHGYDAGIKPDQPPPHDRLSTFFPTLMDVAQTCN